MDTRLGHSVFTVTVVVVSGSSLTIPECDKFLLSLLLLFGNFNMFSPLLLPSATLTL